MSIVRVLMCKRYTIFLLFTVLVFSSNTFSSQETSSEEMSTDLMEFLQDDSRPLVIKKDPLRFVPKCVQSMGFFLLMHYAALHHAVKVRYQKIRPYLSCSR